MGTFKKIIKRMRRVQRDREQQRRLDIKWTLRSGLTVTVRDQGEWLIYNDIFVDREYDFAIQEAFKVRSSNELVTIVDIGANVGFFTLMAADWLLRNSDAAKDFQIVCVEGSPRVFKELQKRLTTESLLTDHLTLIHGLVGQRQGQGMIVEKAFHAMNRVDIVGKSKEKGVLVPYLDLSMKLADIPEIDLLKCDIEGSEQALLQSSPEIFSKVRTAVFELHDYNCDTEKCRRMIKEMGFLHSQTLRQVSGEFSLELYSRK